MNADIEFLDVEDALELQERLIDEFGGSYGIQDTGLLESAIAQARVTFGGVYLHSDLYAKAAASLFHIVKNHPFVDGNKRTGLTCALTLFEWNGVPIDDPEERLYDLTELIARDACTKPEAAAVLRELAGVDGIGSGS